jgi:hypothetical protein
MKTAKFLRRLGTAVAWLGVAVGTPGLIIISLGVWLDEKGEERHHRARMGL